jgi:hypothetical protein
MSIDVTRPRVLIPGISCIEKLTCCGLPLALIENIVRIREKLA